MLISTVCVIDLFANIISLMSLNPFPKPKHFGLLSISTWLVRVDVTKTKHIVSLIFFLISVLGFLLFRNVQVHLVTVISLPLQLTKVFVVRGEESSFTGKARSIGSKASFLVMKMVNMISRRK